MEDRDGFRFVATNIAGPGYESDPDELTYTGCQCRAQSCSNQCPCILRFGPNYDEKGRLIKLEHEMINGENVASKPVVECNAMCQCGEQCFNRVVQNGPSFQLEVFKTEWKGLGLRSLDSIPQNRFVCEYAGELLSRLEAKQRLIGLKEEDSNYILIVREFFPKGELTETIIDPTNRGNFGRFINHSCDPNLFKVPVRVHNDIPRVALFAKRDIPPGEEVTYSYGEQLQTELEVDKLKRKQCFCGSMVCQGYLPVDLSLLS